MLPEPLKEEQQVERVKVPRGVQADREVKDLFLRCGMQALSDRQLLGVLVRSPDPMRSSAELAQDLMDMGDGTLKGLGRLSLETHLQLPGQGFMRGMQLIAALELGRRRYVTEVAERPAVTNSVSCYDLLRGLLEDLPHEEFWVLMLDRGNRVMRKHRVSVGGMHGTVADPKLIYEAALRFRASSIVLAHNHPSGQLRASEEDIRLTRKLVEAGRFLDISVHDHLIVANTGYFSFADNGMLH